jgi:excisionase family DNA binding protein
MSPDPVTPDTPLRLAYRLGDAAERLGVHRITLWRWVRDGKLPSFKIGSLTFIPAEALQPRMQPGCAEPGPYDAVRSNPVVAAISAAHSSGRETPGNRAQHGATRKPVSARRSKGLGQHGAT